MFLFHFAWFIVSGLFRVFAIIAAGFMILNATDDALDEFRSEFSGVQLKDYEHVARSYSQKIGTEMRGHLVAWRQEAGRHNLRHVKTSYRF